MRRKNRSKKRGWYYNTKFSDKISLMYGGILSIIVIVVCLMVTANATVSYLNMRREELLHAVAIVSEQVESRGMLDQKDLDELNLGQNIHAAVYDVSSMAIGASADIITPALGTTIRIDRLSLDFKVVDRDEILSRFLTHVTPVTYNDNYYFVIVEGTYAGHMGIFKAVVMAFIIISSVGIAGAAFSGRYISRKMLKPILDITETAAVVSAKDLNRRIEYEGPDDEIKALTDTFNDMIGRLQEAFDRQTRFISDASHELRTPISVIQGYAKLIDRWGKEDPAILQESIDSIVDETDNMTILIKNMLTLAKYQESSPPSMNVLSLNELAEELVREYTVMETEKKIIIEDAANLSINGNVNLIKQMLRAFVDNSIKYSADNDEPVILSIFEDNEMNCISISDKGAGIEEKDIPHIFERFFRADESRNKEVPGNGIGLSVAAEIIKKHGAQTAVESKIGEGTTITIKFPKILWDEPF